MLSSGEWATLTRKCKGTPKPCRCGPGQPPAKKGAKSKNFFNLAYQEASLPTAASVVCSRDRAVGPLEGQTQDKVCHFFRWGGRLAAEMASIGAELAVLQISKFFISFLLCIFPCIKMKFTSKMCKLI